MEGSFSFLDRGKGSRMGSVSLRLALLQMNKLRPKGYRVGANLYGGFLYGLELRQLSHGDSQRLLLDLAFRFDDLGQTFAVFGWGDVSKESTGG